MKRKCGRPTKLDAELTRTICDLLRDGISITATCDALGVSESKYFDWLKKGEEGEQPYAKFREEATRARANGKIALVRQILADKDWRAKAWYLERCWPSEFGRTAERPVPDEPKCEPEGPTWQLNLSLPDGTVIPATFEAAQRVFCNFPHITAAEAQYRRKAGGNDIVANDDKESSDGNESSWSHERTP